MCDGRRSHAASGCGGCASLAAGWVPQQDGCISGCTMHHANDTLLAITPAVLLGCDWPLEVLDCASAAHVADPTTGATVFR